MAFVTSVALWIYLPGPNDRFMARGNEADHEVANVVALAAKVYWWPWTRLAGLWLCENWFPLQCVDYEKPKVVVNQNEPMNLIHFNWEQKKQVKMFQGSRGRGFPPLSCLAGREKKRMTLFRILASIPAGSREDSFQTRCWKEDTCANFQARFSLFKKTNRINVWIFLMKWFQYPLMMFRISLSEASLSMGAITMVSRFRFPHSSEKIHCIQLKIVQVPFAKSSFLLWPDRASWKRVLNHCETKGLFRPDHRIWCNRFTGHPCQTMVGPCCSCCQCPGAQHDPAKIEAEGRQCSSVSSFISVNHQSSGFMYRWVPWIRTWIIRIQGELKKKLGEHFLSFLY